MSQALGPSRRQLFLTAAAAFGTYFCTYAFRKPFTAATFEGQIVFGFDLKVVLVVSQLIGYMLSKFIGIKVISEMPSRYWAGAIVGLIAIAEVALVGFAFVPAPFKVVLMFVNGLPLGMVFGVVVRYLEGRRHTELLSAALCASFIASSGVVKSVGQWLMLDAGVSEDQMPMLTGLIFAIPLLISVWLLQLTPPPDEADRRLRSERTTMDRSERRQFLAAYWPVLSLLVFVFVALTVIRTLRDDFGVEIWRDMGVTKTPSVFAESEILVAVTVTALNGMAIWIRSNRVAMRVIVSLMSVAFALVGGSALLQQSGELPPFEFMVACGVGLYIPYVAFHTTVFERLIAVSKRRCNLGFLMCLADALGYLGYAVLVVWKTGSGGHVTGLPFFRWTLLIVAAMSILALISGVYWLETLLPREPRANTNSLTPDSVEQLAPTE
jgi:hypothetical protein